MRRGILYKENVDKKLSAKTVNFSDCNTVHYYDKYINKLKQTSGTTNVNTSDVIADTSYVMSTDTSYVMSTDTSYVMSNVLADTSDVTSTDIILRTNADNINNLYHKVNYNLMQTNKKEITQKLSNIAETLEYFVENVPDINGVLNNQNNLYMLQINSNFGDILNTILSNNVTMQFAQSNQSIQIAQSIQSTQIAQSIQSTQIAQSNQSNQSNQSTQSAQNNQSTYTADKLNNLHITLKGYVIRHMTGFIDVPTAVLTTEFTELNVFRSIENKLGYDISAHFNRVFNYFNIKKYRTSECGKSLCVFICTYKHSNSKYDENVARFAENKHYRAMMQYALKILNTLCHILKFIKTDFKICDELYKKNIHYIYDENQTMCNFTQYCTNLTCNKDHGFKINDWYIVSTMTIEKFDQFEIEKFLDIVMHYVYIYNACLKMINVV